MSQKHLQAEIDKLKSDVLMLAKALDAQNKYLEQRSAIVEKKYNEIIDRLNKLEK